jgi:hypothetical protein
MKQWLLFPMGMLAALLATVLLYLAAFFKTGNSPTNYQKATLALAFASAPLEIVLGLLFAHRMPFPAYQPTLGGNIAIYSCIFLTGMGLLYPFMLMFSTPGKTWSDAFRSLAILTAGTLGVFIDLVALLASGEAIGGVSL